MEVQYFNYGSKGDVTIKLENKCEMRMYFTFLNFLFPLILFQFLSLSSCPGMEIFTL